MSYVIANFHGKGTGSMRICLLVELATARLAVFAQGDQGAIRYSEIVKIVGYSSTTTRALKNMEKHSIVKKEVLNEPYRPVSYSLTDN
jgi:DNA-binding HxlR family transcriptional regulator